MENDPSLEVESAKEAEREPVAAPLAPVRFRRAGPLVLLAAAAVLLFFVSPSWPHEQRVRVSLGDLAPRVVSVDLEYASENHDPAHAASFRYAPGKAPRLVEHTPTLPNGQTRIDVVIDLVNPTDRLDLTRNVKLEGETVTLPVSGSSSR